MYYVANGDCLDEKFYSKVLASIKCIPDEKFWLIQMIEVEAKFLYSPQIRKALIEYIGEIGVTAEVSRTFKGNQFA